jgi:hypothetical protein
MVAQRQRTTVHEVGNSCSQQYCSLFGTDAIRNLQRFSTTARGICGLNEVAFLHFQAFVPKMF